VREAVDYLVDGARSAMIYMVWTAALMSRFSFFASTDGSLTTMLVLQTRDNDFGSLQQQTALIQIVHSSLYNTIQS